MPTRTVAARKTAAPAKKTVAPAKKAAAPAAKTGKPKLVRDSFTMPEADFALIAQLKRRTLAFERHTKKSELLRAGLQVLQELDDTKLRKALEALVPLKPGRPKKSG